MYSGIFKNIMNITFNLLIIKRLIFLLKEEFDVKKIAWRS